MSKAKRKVTVDAGKSVPDDSERRKPSVFERLGPGGVRKPAYAEESERRDRYYPTSQEKCRFWAQNEECPFGSKCKFTHGNFKKGKSSKRDDDSSDEPRSRGKGRRERSSDHSDTEQPTRKKRSKSRKEKESRIKSTIVVKASRGGDSDLDSDSSSSWGPEGEALTGLDYKKELELERKRQQLKQELSQLEDTDDVRENLHIERQISSSDSDGDQSFERGRSHKKISKSPSKKKEKKKHKTSKSPTHKDKSKSFRYEEPEKETPKKKHKKKKMSTEKKYADYSDDEAAELEGAKTKKSKQGKVSKSKHMEQRPRLSFQSDEDFDEEFVVKKNRQKSWSKSRSPSRSVTPPAGYDRGRSKKVSPEFTKYESNRSVSPDVKKSKKSARDQDDYDPWEREGDAIREKQRHKGVLEREDASPQEPRKERRARSPPVDVREIEEKHSKKKSKKELKHGKHKQETETRGGYYSDSAGSPISQERAAPSPERGRKGKKHKSDQSRDRSSLGREKDSRREAFDDPERTESPRDYREPRGKGHKDRGQMVSPAASKEREKQRRSVTPEPPTRVSDSASRREFSPESQRSGSQYQRNRRMSPPPVDRRRDDDRYDKEKEGDRLREARGREKDDPRREARPVSPDDRRYGRGPPPGRPEFHPRQPGRMGRYDERRDRFEEERFPAPAPVPPPADERGHRDYGPGRAPFEPPRGRPESYDREHDRYSREYGQPPDNRFLRGQFERGHPEYRDPQYPRDHRDPRDDIRDARDPRGDIRDPRDMRDARGEPRDPRESSWDRSRGPGPWTSPHGPPGHGGRGGRGGPPPPMTNFGGRGRGGFGPNDRFGNGKGRGGRYDPAQERQSRRGEWETQRHDDFFPGGERREWGDRRVDERRDFSREDERRDDRPDDRGFRMDRRGEERRDKEGMRDRPDDRDGMRGGRCGDDRRPRDESMDQREIDRREREGVADARQRDRKDQSQDRDKQERHVEGGIGEGKGDKMEDGQKDGDSADKKQKSEKDKDKPSESVNIASDEKVKEHGEVKEKTSEKRKSDEKSDKHEAGTEERKKSKKKKNKEKDKAKSPSKSKKEGKSSGRKDEAKVEEKHVEGEKDVTSKEKEETGDTKKKSDEDMLVEKEAVKTEDAKDSKDSKKRSHDDGEEPVSPALSSKRARETSPTMSLRSRGSAGDPDKEKSRVQHRDDRDSKRDRSQARSRESDRDRRRERSPGSTTGRRSQKGDERRRERTPDPRDQESKGYRKRSRSPDRRSDKAKDEEEERKRRKVGEQDEDADSKKTEDKRKDKGEEPRDEGKADTKLVPHRHVGQGTVEGRKKTGRGEDHRFSDWTDDSGDDILTPHMAEGEAAPPKVPGATGAEVCSAVPDRVRYEGRKRSNSLGSHHSKHSQGVRRRPSQDHDSSLVHDNKDQKSRDRSPRRRSRDRSPRRRSRDRSPRRRSRERSPRRKSQDRSPSRKSRDRTPSRKSRDVSPNHKSRDRSPSARSRGDRSPSRKSEHINDERTKDSVDEGQTKPDEKSTQSQEALQKLPGKGVQSTGDDGDDDDQMSYDEISSEEESLDGEVEQEEDPDAVPATPAIVDVLQIDFSSFKSDPIAKPASGSALNKYKPAAILSKLGVSRAYAGDELFKKVQRFCQEQAADKENEASEDKQGETTPEVQWSSDVAMLQTSAVARQRERTALIHNIGAHRRGLCARQDLDIRRQLCKLYKNPEIGHSYHTPVFDADLCKLSVQLFKAATQSDKVQDTALATTGIKTEVISPS